MNLKGDAFIIPKYPCKFKYRVDGQKETTGPVDLRSRGKTCKLLKNHE